MHDFEFLPPSCVDACSLLLFKFICICFIYYMYIIYLFYLYFIYLMILSYDAHQC